MTMISCGESLSPGSDRSAQSTSALVSAARPVAVTPSSLGTRILTCPHPTGHGLGRQELSQGVLPPVTVPSPAGGLPPHPRGVPGLLQFTRNARPNAQDLRRLADRPAVAHWPRPPGGHRLR